MRNLRWAAELAVAQDERQSKLGFAQLQALSRSDMLDAAEQHFIDAALRSVVKHPVVEIDEGTDADQGVAVVQVADRQPAVVSDVDSPQPDVVLDRNPENEEGE